MIDTIILKLSNDEVIDPTSANIYPILTYSTF